MKDIFKKTEGVVMTITQLNTFLEIAKKDSFSAAANSLGYAQSTVTMQIKQLEDELGCPLFERLGKTITLTSAGERLVSYAERILQLEREIHLEVSDEENTAGVLKLGVSETLCISRLPKVLMEYKKSFPQMEIRVQFINHEDISVRLASGELDMVYTLNPLIEDESVNVIYKKKETMGFYSSPDFSMVKSRISEADLEGVPLLLTDHDCNFRHMLVADLMECGVTPQIEVETSSKEVLKQFAKNGHGITFIPDMAAEKEISEGTLRRLTWKGNVFRIYSQVIVHKDKHMNKAISSLIQLIKTDGKNR